MNIHDNYSSWGKVKYLYKDIGAINLKQYDLVPMIYRRLDSPEIYTILRIQKGESCLRMDKSKKWKGVEQ